MKILPFAALGLAAVLAACGKPAETPVAPEGTPMVTEAAPAPAADVTADLPADQTTPAQTAELEKAAAAAGLPVTRQTRTSFKCDNDETIEVRFFPDQGIAVLVRGGQNEELQQEAAASGFKYSNGQTTIQGKGAELLLNVGMMATAKCVAA